MAPTEGQGIPDYVDGPSEQYDGIARMIRATLAEGQYTDPDKSVLIRAGVKLVHPKTYAGGSDLEEFEVFVAGILRWLKMNCLLGATSTEMQVSYLGTRLTGEAQEWFYRNVERYDREVRDWTLESVIQGLQKRFLHTLTHHHASNKFDTVSQGTKTVQEVLNDLKKYAARMIHPPDVYTFRKRFVAALRESLRNEVLKKGYNAEFSTIEQLYETARMVEEASRYNHGMQRVENATATAASSAKLTAQKTRPQTGQTRASLGRESTTQQMPMARAYSAPKPEQRFAQVKDSSTKPSYRQKPLPRPPEKEISSTSNTCYECGQVGHIRPNCPRLAGKMRSAAIRPDETMDPELDPQDNEVLPPDKEGEGEDEERQEEEPLDEERESPRYPWDIEEEETEDNAVSYRSNAIRIALDDNSATTKMMAARPNTTVTNKTVEPMHSHRSRHQERPNRPHSDNRTLTGYWEINGVKAHCLLDSGSEGVFLSPEFTRATGTKTFALAQPITLQLACIGSRSMINYGANATIKFGRETIEEYFDIANVEHYDAILGTPFLRKMGIVLDFKGPGTIRMGNEVIPIDKVSFKNSNDTGIATSNVASTRRDGGAVPKRE